MLNQPLRDEFMVAVFQRAAELKNYNAKEPHKVRAFLSCHLDGSREKPAATIEVVQ